MEEVEDRARLLLALSKKRADQRRQQRRAVRHFRLGGNAGQNERIDRLEGETVFFEPAGQIGVFPFGTEDQNLRDRLFAGGDLYGADDLGGEPALPLRLVEGGVDLNRSEIDRLAVPEDGEIEFVDPLLRQKVFPIPRQALASDEFGRSGQPEFDPGRFSARRRRERAEVPQLDPRDRRRKDFSRSPFPGGRQGDEVERLPFAAGRSAWGPREPSRAGVVLSGSAPGGRKLRLCRRRDRLSGSPAASALPAARRPRRRPRTRPLPPPARALRERSGARFPISEE